MEKFEDTIKARIVKVRDTGGKDLEIELFTGERQRHVPAFMDNRGNPLISIFLQRDVNEMDGITEGNWRYFHREIKLALQDNARIEMVKFTFKGMQLKGEKISITPYKDDPRSEELGEYANKYYTFTLSEEIPGYIYQIEAITPGKHSDADTSPDIAAEVLTYKGIECDNEPPCVQVNHAKISLPASGTQSNQRDAVLGNRDENSITRSAFAQ